MIRSGEYKSDHGPAGSPMYRTVDVSIIDNIELSRIPD